MFQKQIYLWLSFRSFSWSVCLMIEWYCSARENSRFTINLSRPTSRRFVCHLNLMRKKPLKKQIGSFSLNLERNDLFVMFKYENKKVSICWQRWELIYFNVSDHRCRKLNQIKFSKYFFQRFSLALPSLLAKVMTNGDWTEFVIAT